MIRTRFIIVLLILSFSGATLGREQEPTANRTEKGNYPVEIRLDQVRENHPFYGLAFYYNSLNFHLVDKDGPRRIDTNQPVTLAPDQWLAVVGRLRVLLVKGAGLTLELDEHALRVPDSSRLEGPGNIVKVVSKNELKAISPELDRLRYVHLWDWLAWLAKAVEASLVTIQTHVISNWALAIVAFSITLKLLLIPVSLMTVRFQRRVSQVQSQLEPVLADIKQHYEGEEAHNRLMKAHKDLGVTPFYSLKPMTGSLIQIPILVAVFNALGEMPQLEGQPFLWFSNLAYPDAAVQLPFSVPMFGDTLNLLPFIMTVVTIFSTVIFQNTHAPAAEVRRQKRNLYLMAAAFFVLFYPFPASMVFYWALANILQTIQQKLIRI